MPETSTDIDNVRYEHHLKHRGSANKRMFWVIWMCILAFLLFRFGQALFAFWSKRISDTHKSSSWSPKIPSAKARALAHMTAIAVLPCPQLLNRTLTELSMGRIAALTAYSLIVVVLLLSVDAPNSTQHFFDDVAFRAAWVTVTQIPVVFLLSTKNGLINVVAGLPYDRVLYLHKWAGRMIFVSATTHVVIMKSSISMADILLSPDISITVVRYGVASYMVLIWIALSSVMPIRKWSYRAFYINHWISTLAFLMLILQHMPKHALIPIYMAFSFVAVDKVTTFVLFFKNNISVRPLQSRLAKFRRGPGRAVLLAGYVVEMMEPYNLSISTDTEESTTAIRICNVPITWRPGQHIRLYLPGLARFEMHPFTPANCSSIAVPPPLPPRRSEDIERRGSVTSVASYRQTSDVLLMIRARSGLTKRLKEFHTEWLKLPCPNATISTTATSLTAYVDGPYGNPPSWENYENLILLSTSTGVSFALSVVDYLEQLSLYDASKLKTQMIRFIWIVRHIDPQFEATVAELLRRYGTTLKGSGVRIETELHATCLNAELEYSMIEIDRFAHLRPCLPRYGSGDRTLTIRNPDEIYDEWEEEERQWAELEALEEMQMQQIEPFEDADTVSSVRNDEEAIIEAYEGEGYASSETSTLLNDANTQQDLRQSNIIPNPRLAVDGTAALSQSSPLSSPVCSPLKPRHMKTEKRNCDCASIQYQRQKLHRVGKSLFDSCSYGSRPNVSRLVSLGLNSNQHSGSMVAACANGAVSRHARIAVAQAKLAFARGQRASDVELFTEGFS